MGAQLCLPGGLLGKIEERAKPEKAKLRADLQAGNSRHCLNPDSSQS
jgi:hypothetical protein